MNCCGKIFNLTIFVCNFFIFLTGCAILGLGAYIQANLESFGDFMIDYHVNSGVILMVMGGIILFVAFLGCCGAGTESACLMYTYATAIAFILVIEIGAAVALLVLKDDVYTALEKGLVDGLDNYGVESNFTDAYKATTQSWDELQTHLHCCGVTDYADWENNPTLNATQSVPDTCCKEISEGCGIGELKSQATDNIYTNGCLQSIFNVIKNNITFVAIGAACVVGIQFIIICVACCLANNMKKQSKYEQK